MSSPTNPSSGQPSGAKGNGNGKEVVMTDAPPVDIGTLDAFALFGAVNRERKNIQGFRMGWLKRALPEEVSYWNAGIDKFPAELRGQEPHAEIMYPEYLDIDEKKRFPMNTVHFGEQMYRGHDVARFPLKIGNGKPKQATEWRHCAVYLPEVVQDDVKNKTYGTTNSAYAHENTADSTDLRDARYRIVPDTQRPYVHLQIVVERTSSMVDDPDKPGEQKESVKTKTVHWLCFAEAFKHTKPDGSPDLNLHVQLGDDKLLQHSVPKGDLALSQLLEKKDLVCTQLILPSNRGIVWKDISPEDRDELSKAWMEQTVLSPGQKLVRDLDDARQIVLFAELKNELAPQYRQFVEFSRAVFFATAHLGSFWYYHLVNPEAGIHTEKYPFKAVDPPRWLVQQWRIKQVNGTNVSAQPIEWLPFNKPAGSRYPDLDTYAFELRLGVAREAHKSDRDFSQTLDRSGMKDAGQEYIPMHDGETVAEWNAKKIRVYGHFMNNPQNKDVLVNISMQGGHNEAGSMKMPGYDRKIVLGLNYGGYDCFFTGSILDDITNSGAQMTALVTAKAGNKIAVPDSSAEKGYQLILDFPDDPTANNRSLNAVSLMQKGQKRRVGVFIPEIALGAPRPRDQQTAWLHKHFRGNPAKHTAYHAELDRQGLNDKQRAAANDLASPTTTGAFGLWGPYGTGKTKALAAVAKALVATDTKVMICASQNEAVNRCLEVFVKDLPPSLEATAFCRFTGALRRISTHDDTAEDKSEDSYLPSDRYIGSWADSMAAQDEEARNNQMASIFEMAAVSTGKMGNSSQIADPHGFGKMKLAFVEHLAASTPADIQKTRVVRAGKNSAKEAKATHDSARKYLEALHKLRQGTESLSKKESKDLRAEFRGLDEYWTTVYVSRWVKAIFVTNSSSCHESLLDSWRPEVIIQDEAGQSTPADAIIPLAFFMEYIKLWIMTGDPKQFKPTLTSKGANESEMSMIESIYTREILAEPKRIDWGFLNVQYRLDPQLSAYPNATLYKNLNMVDAPSTAIVTDLQKRITASMKPFKDQSLWNGRFRVGIDFSADGDKSERWESSTSMYNQSEGAWIVDTVAGMVKAGISPADILLITPYDGQRRFLRRELHGQNTEVRAREVRVMSTYSSQGHEGKIVFFSLVKNVPGNPDSSAFPTTDECINVGITRPQDCLFLVGQLVHYKRHLNVKDRKGLLKSDNRKYFAGLIHDLFEKKDVFRGLEWDEVLANPGKVMYDGSIVYRGGYLKPKAPTSVPGAATSHAGASGRADIREESTLGAFAKKPKTSHDPASEPANRGRGNAWTQGRGRGRGARGGGGAL
ncbi:ATP-dependent RNA helicase [Recurvomyces mirabilis]|uniref:ATP-dependent RNA helicase n=1 Tax=Recurvomyces mirabilis TaxID=574656 RepID=A0AAE0TPK0_9PEZI|nr:ATP-dependent RNA helicase [Recurvomyces mirabilis]KAK5150245.1 hypothetical protein LTS14_010221 [Recurvomyces mirabilis]